MVKYVGVVEGDLRPKSGIDIFVDSKIVGWGAGLRGAICQIIVGNSDVHLGKIGYHPAIVRKYHFLITVPAGLGLQTDFSLQIASNYIDSVRLVFRPYSTVENAYEIVAIVKFHNSGDTREVPLWLSATDAVELQDIGDLFDIAYGSESYDAYMRALAPLAVLA